jgi:hypothetical protein
MIPPARAASGSDRIDPLAMTVAQAAKVLSAVSAGVVPEEMIRRHIAAGAPATSDGRINLVHYAAWLNQRMGPDGHDKDELATASLARGGHGA